MISDLRSLTDGTQLECDICVVGAGAAGLAIATQLAKSTRRVVVLESGGEELEDAAQELYRANIAGVPYIGHELGRFRALGGTTKRWGGQALPLSAWDFARRPWIPLSGWPVPYHEVARYYPRAHEFMGIDQEDYGTGLATVLRTALPRMEGSGLEPHFAKWTAQPDMAERHGSALRRAANVTVLLHANLTTIDISEGGVAQLRARTLEGKEIRVRPKAVVLACGGLETARVLLANRHDHPAGIGNEHDLVGRYLMDHPGGRIGVLTPRDGPMVQRMFNVYHRRGRKYTVRFALSRAVQEREQVASASGTLMFVPDSDSPFASLKALYHLVRQRRVGSELVTPLAAVLRGAPSLIRPALGYARGRTYTPRPTVLLIVSCEQEPLAESRLTLAPDRDALGMPRLVIDWRMSDLTIRTARTFGALARAQLAGSGVGSVALDDWLDDPQADWRRHLNDHYHHIGTTRMDPDPRRGVVDTDCRVHGVRNLYVASSAVFPTGGFSNPTLTILALAMRLADHLSATLRPR